MCLTGVDYFSTLGYQPGIAFLAAGALAPVATLVLVLLTLFGALPMYRRVAALSPHGQGSIQILEEMLPRWRGKALVLCLLGFAATGFVITITMSAADAAEHVLQNPLVPQWMHHPVLLTLVLLAALGAIFLKGFREAIGLAVPIVFVYLALNVVVIAWGLHHLWSHPEAFPGWMAGLAREHASVPVMALAALLVFPKLALGLSGFETGVAVMPLVRGEAGDTEEHPTGRIRHTHRLLTTAALHKLHEARQSHHLPPGQRVLFLEVRPGDASEFSDVLEVRGVEVSGHRVLRCTSPAIPNAIAALLLYCRDRTGHVPHAYFGWTEGNPIAYLLKYLALGEGDTAPVTREVLRQTEPNPERRPRIHLG